MTGQIFDIADFCTQDGPGIRSVIFFKGCPLSCLWCSNPESQNFFAEPLHHAELCIKCHQCAEACPLQAISLQEGYRIKRNQCQKCLEHPCIEACPEEALKLVGESRTIDEVMKRVLPQRSFYQNSGGGITFSGGEPMAQAEFAFALAERIKEEGLNLGLETCGYFSNDLDLKLFRLFDFVFFDLKHFDPALHESYTGKSNQLILNNLKALCKALNPESVTLSIPMVPGVNDDELFFVWVIQTAKELGIGKTRLLPYHEYGRAKYLCLGREYPLPNIPLIEDSQYHYFATMIKAGGLACEIVGLSSEG